MRINTNLMAYNTHIQYIKNTNRIAGAVAKLSSGDAITKAADNPAGLIISEKLRARIRELNISSANVQNAISLVQTADGALSGIQSVLQRMNELAVQASSDTYHDEDRAAMQAEFDRLQAEINDIASSADFNNIGLFGGTPSGRGTSSSSLTFQVGADDSRTMTINIDVLDTARLGISKAGVSTREAAQNAITSVNNEISAISARRANLSANENRLNDLSERLTTTCENLSAADSRIREVDFAKEVTEFATASILQKVDTAMLVQANAQPQSVLFLLKSFTA